MLMVDKWLVVNCFLKILFVAFYLPKLLLEAMHTCALLKLLLLAVSQCTCTNLPSPQKILVWHSYV